MRAINLPFTAYGTASGRRALIIILGVVCLHQSPGWAGPLTTLYVSTPTGVTQAGSLVLLQPGSRLRRQPTKREEEKAAEAQAAKQDKISLPPSYRVPPMPTAEIEISKELEIPLKKDSKDPDYPKWREHLRQMGRYQSLLIKGSFNDAKVEKELLRYGISYRLKRMTHRKVLLPDDEERKKVDEAEKRNPEIPETITSLREDILADLRKTGTAPNGSYEIRDAFLEILVDEAPKLLDNNIYVRYSVVEILCNINARDESREKGQSEEPYYKVIRPLVAVLDDPKQPVVLKLHPPIALARICRHKNCKTDDRFLIIETLVKQMTLAKTEHPGFGVRVVEGLATLGDPNDRTRQPVAVEAVAKVLKDPGYNMDVQIEAAYFLGRMPLEAYKKIDEIAIEIVQLVEKMAQEYEKDRANPIWKSRFLTIYSAFRPKDEAERTAQRGLITQVDSKPVLAASKTIVTDAYQLTLPIVRTVLGVKEPTSVVEQLRKIKTWLNAQGKNGGKAVAKE